ncbi:DivIVA domain-containing protein [Reichenbachiella agarivorans]|uniref:DivIVA domain-containing protein n=1 Tax=Reichenbachiella agarivorans TaxID=2979464 RepID=A0ABY6CJG8_9BACT|nr:DivIVA domain-containing protein [Reichenbachiella agarivorans]UXP30666.1 DivIVA domain-containing protein [Reichenbachiella agarivorans]
MKITPLEIRQKSFEKAFRGINKEEVHAFLLSLSHEWERLLDEKKGLSTQVEKLEKEVQKLREVENTLFKTLKTAEDTGASVVDQANKMAELHMRETQINAEALMNDAKNKARAMIDRAEDQAKEIINEMTNEVKELEEDYRIIENQRDNVISQLRVLSGDMMNKVEKIKHQESGIETHLKKVKRMLRETSERVEHKAESINFDSEEFAKPTPVVVPKAKLEVATDEFGISENDKRQVKKNYIMDSNPISREPATKPKALSVEKKVSNKDLSFFDQLED